MSLVRANKWFLVAVLVVLIVNTLAVSVNRAPVLDVVADRSSYRFNTFGYRAWYRLMVRLGFDVARVETPVDQALSELDQLWIVNPTQPFTRSEMRALRVWVEGGGDLICALDGSALDEMMLEAGYTSDYASPTSHEFAELAELSLSSDAQGPVSFMFESGIDAISAEKVKPKKGARYCEDVAEVVVPLRGRVEDGGEGAEHVISDDAGAILVRRRVGEGSIIATANPDMFANKWIGQADNACLAANLVASAPGEGRIGIDEYHHGFRAMASARDVAVAFEGRWGLAQIAVLGLLALATAARRFGSVRPLPSKPRRSALEYVDSMAGLYRKATARTAAVSILRRAARRRLARRAGASPAVEDGELMALVAARRLCDPLVAKAVLLLAEKRSRECASDDDLIEIARRLDTLRGSSRPYGGS